MGREGDWDWGREHNGVESCIIKLYTRNLHNGINQCYPNKSQFLKGLTFKTHTHKQQQDSNSCIVHNSPN